MSKYFQQSFQSATSGPESVDAGVEKWVDTLNAPAGQVKPAQPGNGAAHTVTTLKTLQQQLETEAPVAQRMNTKMMRKSPAELSVFNDEENTTQSIVEAYRALRTRLLRAQATKGMRSVVVTSSIQGEGKTFTASNTAVCLAQLHSERVLLMDGDLRTGGLSHFFGEPDGPGLADALEGKIAFSDVVMATPIKNLWFMPVGRSALAAPELFAGPRWKEMTEWAASEFSITVVDAPPITMLADTELIIAGCDAVVAVVRTRTAPREIVEQAAHRIEKAKLLGVVMNGVEVTRANSYGSYYKSYYRAQNGRKKA